MEKIGLQICRFFKRFSEPPENVPEINYRYHFTAGYSFFIALLYHFTLIFVFYLISATALSLLNILSTMLWITIVWAHLNGMRILSSSLAVFEVNLHATVCVIFIGWGSGFQYYLLAAPMMVFFSDKLKIGLKFFFTFVTCVIFAGLFLIFEGTTSIYTVALWAKNALNYINITSIFFILSISAYYYNTATVRAEKALEQEKLRIEEMASLLKKMFGRYFSIEVMNSLIKNPSAIELGGEKRSVTIMLSDLRGFTALSERISPEEVVQMLNVYFEFMVEVILRYQGTINEIVGDSLLIIFGAPQEMPDRSSRAVACAIEMQNAMTQVNAQNRERGLPELEMGIGVNETEVVVGNIGSAKRSKYAAVGSGVNMTSRIESYCVGGQILISESMRLRVGNILRIDGQQDVFPKGSETPIRIYDVGGIAGSYNLFLASKVSDFVTLSEAIPIKVRVLEDKNVGSQGIDASITELSVDSAIIKASGPIEEMSNLKMNLAGVEEKLSSKVFYGKVIPHSDKLGSNCRVRFTSMPSEADAYLLALRHFAVKKL
ncbi:MAG: adenylate/guanylate cyclase domain-containing protein [Deltaproteobacteria bacterium]|nr:adenylate/guanylate cyclase domain-containing protein [Deltaproteobacteria bacterium]